MTYVKCSKCGERKPEEAFYWRKKNVTRHKECRDCMNKRHNDYYHTHKEIWKKYEKENYPRIIARKRQRYKEMRLKIIKHYGGDPPQCACCEEDIYEFLTIHHIAGDGAEHRKSLGGRNYTWYVYRDIIRNNFPEGYQVLCYNCNCAIGFHGVCPHKTQVASDFGSCGTCGLELTDDEEAYYSGDCFSCYVKNEMRRKNRYESIRI